MKNTRGLRRCLEVSARKEEGGITRLKAGIWGKKRDKEDFDKGRYLGEMYTKHVSLNVQKRNTEKLACSK
jgi:hypothetical protein